MNYSKYMRKRTQNPFIKNELFITFDKRGVAFLRYPTRFIGDVAKYFFQVFEDFLSLPVVFQE